MENTAHQALALLRYRMTGDDLRQLSEAEGGNSTDEAMGIAWWNGLTEQERARWMLEAGNTGVAADAWAAFKAKGGNDRAGRQQRFF